MASDWAIIISWYTSAVVLIVAGPVLAWLQSKQYYHALNKFNFAPSLNTHVVVSIAFIALAATSGWMFQLDDGNVWSTSLTLVSVYLGLDLVFSLLFFIMHWFVLAFAAIMAAATVAILACVHVFPINLLCGWLCLPSTVWAVLNAYLSLTLMLNNREHSVSIKKSVRTIAATQRRVMSDYDDEVPEIQLFALR